MPVRIGEVSKVNPCGSEVLKVDSEARDGFEARFVRPGTHAGTHVRAARRCRPSARLCHGGRRGRHGAGHNAAHPTHSGVGTNPLGLLIIYFSLSSHCSAQLGCLL